MQPSNFYIFHTINGDIIRDTISKLEINIHNLKNNSFQPNPAELQFYNNEGSLAFETIKIKDYLRPRVANALLWYIDHIGHPEMQISSEYPTPVDAPSKLIPKEIIPNSGE